MSENGRKLLTLCSTVAEPKMERNAQADRNVEQAISELAARLAEAIMR